MKRRGWARIGDAILGTKKGLRLRVRLTLLSASVFLTWLLTLVFMSQLDLVSPVGVAVVALYDLCGLPIFYLMIRTGWASRLRDSGMVEQQMIFASGVTAIGYLFFPSLRAALMQAMCMSQAFGLFTLRPNQTIRMGIVSIAMLYAVLLIAPMLDLKALQTSFDRDVESLRLFTSSFIILLLSLVSRHYALLRQKITQEKHELSRAVRQVNELVTRDTLTGLYNRQHLQTLLELERSRFARNNTPFCVALIDLDHFKQINDTYGHQLGDEVLVAFAKSARAMLRNSDIPARWGGEEFLVLMPATEPSEQGLIGIRRLLDHFSSFVPCPKVPTLKTSFSVGVACIRPHETISQLLERADRALYEAKAAGRNCCRLASGESFKAVEPALAPSTSFSRTRQSLAGPEAIPSVPDETHG